MFAQQWSPRRLGADRNPVSKVDRTQASSTFKGNNFVSEQSAEPLMMLRRSLAATLLAAAGVASAFAQSAAAPSPVPNDNLNLRFANGIAAVAEDKVITVDDVRREIAQYIPNLEK